MKFQVKGGVEKQNESERWTIDVTCVIKECEKKVKCSVSLYTSILLIHVSNLTSSE